MPGMRCDLVLDNASRRLVIDTKFSKILCDRPHGGDAFKSDNLYQLYAYLRSQEGHGAAADAAEGLLLHPSLDREIDEAVTLNGHRVRFATLDLAAPPGAIRSRLLSLATDSI